MCFCSGSNKAEETQHPPERSVYRASSEPDTPGGWAQAVIKKKIKFIGERFKPAPIKRTTILLLTYKSVMKALRLPVALPEAEPLRSQGSRRE